MNLTERLHDLVADEPPYLLDPDRVLTGARTRRQARVAVASGLLAAGTVSAVAAVLLLQPLGPSRTPGTATLVVHPASSATAATATGPLQQLVREHSDASWTYEVHHEDAQGIDADVDDGTGAGRFGLWLSPPPGSIQQHPCSDAEFAEGARCLETQLDEDTRLVVKGPGRSGPVTVLVVVLVHRDGSGVMAESDNATWPWPRGGVITPEDKRRLSTARINRERPLWTETRLVELVKAADATIQR